MVFTRRRPKNVSEGECYDLLVGEGWNVSKRGWPDFFAFRDGKICLVEVKPKRSHRLKKEQRFIMTQLAKFGIPCYKWTPDGGLEKIGLSVPE